MLIWIEAHPSLASWLQALFSVLAILFASFTPWLHEKSKERRTLAHSRHLFAFLAHRQYELFLYLHEPLNESIHDQGKTLTEYERSGESAEWMSHRAALDAISVVGFTAKEVNSVIYLRTAADYALRLIQALPDWSAVDESSIQTLREIKSYMKKTERIYKETGIVSDQELF